MRKMPEAILKVKSGSQEGREFRIGTSPVTIGRRLDNDIILDDKSISGRHAAIFPSENGFVIRDLDSRNGTKVNNIPVTESDLKDGDTVMLGRVKLKFIILQQENELSGQSDDVSGNSAASVKYAGQQDRTPPASEDQIATAQGFPHARHERVFEAVIERDLTMDYRRHRDLESKRPSRSRIILIAILIPILVLALKMLFPSENVLRSFDMIRVGESKMVVVRPSYTGTPKVSNPSIIECKTTEEDFLLIITGLREGVAVVSMKSITGEAMELKVIVKGALRPEADPYEHRPLTAEQRVELASTFIQEGDQLIDARPFEAGKRYLRAKKILAPLTLKPKEYFLAERKAIEAQEAVDRKFETLRFSVRQAINKGDKLAAQAELQRILELIPDTLDLRHQKARIYLRILSR